MQLLGGNVSLAIQWYLLFRPARRWGRCLAFALVAAGIATARLWAQPADYLGRVALLVPGVQAVDLPEWEHQWQTRIDVRALPRIELELRGADPGRVEAALRYRMDAMRLVVEHRERLAVLDGRLKIAEAATPEERALRAERERRTSRPGFAAGPVVVERIAKPWGWAIGSAAVGAVIVVGILPILLAEWWRREWAEAEGGR